MIYSSDSAAAPQPDSALALALAANEGLIAAAARRVPSARRLPWADILQVGRLAIIQAFRRFREGAAAFATFAFAHILAALRRAAARWRPLAHLSEAAAARLLAREDSVPAVLTLPDLAPLRPRARAIFRRFMELGISRSSAALIAAEVGCGERNVWSSLRKSREILAKHCSGPA